MLLQESHYSHVVFEILKAKHLSSLWWKSIQFSEISNRVLWKQVGFCTRANPVSSSLIHSWYPVVSPQKEGREMLRAPCHGPTTLEELLLGSWGIGQGFTVRSSGSLSDLQQEVMSWYASAYFTHSKVSSLNKHHKHLKSSSFTAGQCLKGDETAIGNFQGQHGMLFQAGWA